MKQMIRTAASLALAFGVLSVSSRPARALAAPSPLTAAQINEAAPSAQAANPGPDQLKKNLMGVFLASARIKDLLTQPQPNRSALTPSQNALLQKQTQAVQNDLSTLENWRYQFYYHPKNVEDGRQTVAALAALLSDVHQMISGISQFESPSAAAPFTQPQKELAGIEAALESYLGYPGKPPKKTLAAVTKPASPATKPVIPRAVSSPPAKPAATVQSHRNAAHRPSAPAINPGADQLKKALTNVYLDSARIKDLLSLPQPGLEKMSPSEKVLLHEQTQALRDDLVNLEKWRYQLYYHPTKAEYARQTARALGILLAHLHQTTSGISQFESPSAAVSFAQPQKQLASIQKTLQSYVVYLQNQREKSMAALTKPTPGLETVHITPRAVSSPPVESLATAAPPLTPAQVKAILYQIYISVFRIRDLLSQEHPQSWKASRSQQAVGAMSASTLLARAGRIEKWRELFSEHPDNMYYGFEVFRTVENVFQPLDVFRLSVARNESPKLAVDYQRRANDLEANLARLTPYVAFILRQKSNGIALYQSDLASCQARLSYAMHGSLRPSTSMKDILPVFQGGPRHSSKTQTPRADARKDRRHDRQ